MPQERIICVVGPTASGKTALGVDLALALDGEVVSADSMQIYRGLNIGTAKPTAREMRCVPHHMIDIAEPEEEYSVARYVKQAELCVRDILNRGKLPIIVGGSGLYVDALINGREFSESPKSGLREELTALSEQKGIEAVREILKEGDPASYERLHPNDHKRIIRAAEVLIQTGSPIALHNEVTSALPPKYKTLKIGLNFNDREQLYKRIDLRVESMLNQGLVDEVKTYMQRLSQGTAFQAIGYKEPAMYLRGECSYDEAIELLKRESRRYAKRQLTWLRRDAAICWILRDDATGQSHITNQAIGLSEKFLNNY